VGETGANGTNLTDYVSSISCSDGTSTTGSGPFTVNVITGSNIVCTITNTRKATIELKKAWVGTAGLMTLNIGSSAAGTQVKSQLTGANGGAPLTTGQQTVDTGTFYVSETGGLTNYDSTLACFNDNGAGGGTANNGTKDGSEPTVTVGASNSVSVGSGDHVVCTFTNTKEAHLTLVKLENGATPTTVYSFTLTGGPTPGITPVTLDTSGGNTLDFGGNTLADTLLPIILVNPCSRPRVSRSGTARHLSTSSRTRAANMPSMRLQRSSLRRSGEAGCV
jgi:hypothetical protein